MADFRTVRMRLSRFAEIADLEEYTVCGLAGLSVDIYIENILPVARLGARLGWLTPARQLILLTFHALVDAKYVHMVHVLDPHFWRAAPRHHQTINESFSAGITRCRCWA